MFFFYRRIVLLKKVMSTRTWTKKPEALLAICTGRDFVKETLPYLCPTILFISTFFLSEFGEQMALLELCIQKKTKVYKCNSILPKNNCHGQKKMLLFNDNENKWSNTISRTYSTSCSIICSSLDRFCISAER